MQPTLAAYGDFWFEIFGYGIRFLFYAFLATVAGVGLGWLIWGKKGDSAERIEEENDRLLREFHTLQEDLEKIEG